MKDNLIGRMLDKKSKLIKVRRHTVDQRNGEHRYKKYSKLNKKALQLKIEIRKIDRAIDRNY